MNGNLILGPTGRLPFDTFGKNTIDVLVARRSTPRNEIKVAGLKFDNKATSPTGLETVVTRRAVALQSDLHLRRLR